MSGEVKLGWFVNKAGRRQWYARQNGRFVKFDRKAAFTPKRYRRVPDVSGGFVRVTVGVGISAEKRKLSYTYTEITRNRVADVEAAQLRGREKLAERLPDMVAREMGNNSYRTVKAWADYLRDNAGYVNRATQPTRETSLKVFFDDWSN